MGKQSTIIILGGGIGGIVTANVLTKKAGMAAKIILIDKCYPSLFWEAITKSGRLCSCAS